MPRSRRVFAILLIFYLFRRQCCELFTSVAHLEAFIQVKFELLDRVRGYVEQSERRLHHLERFIERDGNTRPENGDKRAVNVSAAAHAVQLLVTFSRLRKKKRAVFAWLADAQQKRKQLKSYVEDIRVSLPSREDIDGAANAIIRLQQTYKMNTTSFIQLNAQHAGRPLILALDEIYHIGRIAFSKEKMVLTKQWMLLALEKFTNHTQESGVRNHLLRRNVDYYVDIRDHLAYANFKMGLYSEALKYTQEIVQRDIHNNDARSNLEILNTILNGSSHDGGAPQIEQEEYHMQHRYEALCRGEYSRKNIKQRTSDSRYRCAYVRNDPLLVLRPVKYERISIDPEIFLYYEIVSNREVQILKGLAFPYLERANVSESNKLQTVSYRISKSGWLTDDHHEVVRKLSRRIEAITGLDTKTSEDLQIANYGIGGHYEPHYDWSRNFEYSVMKTLGHGNRIATALIYLNDVISGGATVFPDAGVEILPEKGTLAFWYNLHLNGSGNTKTIHAACPVMLGTKWVATKWFHERGQEFRRPCSKNRMS